MSSAPSRISGMLHRRPLWSSRRTAEAAHATLEHVAPTCSRSWVVEGQSGRQVGGSERASLAAPIGGQISSPGHTRKARFHARLRDLGGGAAGLTVSAVGKVATFRNIATATFSSRRAPTHARTVLAGMAAGGADGCVSASIMMAGLVKRLRSAASIGPRRASPRSGKSAPISDGTGPHGVDERCSRKAWHR